MLSKPMDEVLLSIAGALHFVQLPATFMLARRVLPFKRELAKITPVVRHVLLVTHIAVTLTMQATGVLVVTYRSELASGEGLAFGFLVYLVALFLMRFSAQCIYRLSGVWPTHREGAVWHALLSIILGTQTLFYMAVCL